MNCITKANKTTIATYEFSEQDIIDLLVKACGLEEAEVAFDIRQGGGFLCGATVTALAKADGEQVDD